MVTTDQIKEYGNIENKITDDFCTQHLNSAIAEIKRVITAATFDLIEDDEDHEFYADLQEAEKCLALASLIIPANTFWAQDLSNFGESGQSLRVHDFEDSERMAKFWKEKGYSILTIIKGGSSPAPGINRRSAV